MTNYNELGGAIAESMIRDVRLDDETSIVQASGGDLFIRLRDQVFQVDIEELDEFTFDRLHGSRRQVHGYPAHSVQLNRAEVDKGNLDVKLARP